MKRVSLPILFLALLLLISAAFARELVENQDEKIGRFPFPFPRPPLRPFPFPRPPPRPFPHPHPHPSCHDCNHDCCGLRCCASKEEYVEFVNAKRVH